MRKIEALSLVFPQKKKTLQFTGVKQHPYKKRSKSPTIYQCPCLQSNHKSIRRNAEQLVAGPMGGIGNSSIASTKARKVALLSPHPVSAFNSSIMLNLS
jgi:hypothetical protein